MVKSYLVLLKARVDRCKADVVPASAIVTKVSSKGGDRGSWGGIQVLLKARPDWPKADVVAKVASPPPLSLAAGHRILPGSNPASSHKLEQLPVPLTCPSSSSLLKTRVDRCKADVVVKVAISFPSPLLQASASCLPVTLPALTRWSLALAITCAPHLPLIILPAVHSLPHRN